MKFLVEFVTCCRTGSSQSAPWRAEEEMRSLAIESPPPSPAEPGGRRMESLSASRSRSSAADWRPSLCSISEDKVATGREREQRTILAPAAERMLKRKVGSATSRVHVRSYTDDSGRSGYSWIMPAFTPTPFFF